MEGSHHFKSESCVTIPCCNAGQARDQVAEEVRGVSDLASHDLQQLLVTNAGGLSLCWLM